MKLIGALYRKTYAPGFGRNPQPPNKVPFQEILPLRLKDRVSGKSDKAAAGGCMHEMTLLMSCLSNNEFENKFCQKEVDKFQTCYKKFIVDSFNSKKAQEKGILVPGESNLTHKQIKRLFTMRPIV